MTPGPPSELPFTPIAAEIDEFCERHRLAERYRALDRAPEFPRAEFRAMGEAGLLGLSVPPHLGGRGLPLPGVAASLYRLAYRSGTAFAKLALQPEFSSVLSEGGSAELRERYYRPLVRGQLLIGNQITEPSAGADAAAIGLVAERTAEGYRLTGVKSEAAFAADADAAIVFGRLGGQRGLTAFLVPQELPGISRSVLPDLGERWMRRGTVTYHAVDVPADHRLGAEGAAFELVRRELTRERALLATIYLGVARASWEETVDHVGSRTAFGAPLSAAEGISFPLVDDWAEGSAALLYALNVLERFAAGQTVDAEAAMAKVLATEVALRALDHAIQFHGGRGYSAALPHEQRWRDVRSGPIAHGPSEVLRLLAARRLWRAR